MRTTVFFIAIMLSMAVAQGENYFRQGTSWHYSNYEYWAQEPVTKYGEHWIEGDTIIDGVSAMKMYGRYNGYDLGLMSIIRTEGDRVYALNRYADTREWVLAYDFGMVPGESAYVGSVVVGNDLSQRIEETRLTLVEITTSDKFPGVEVMVFDETHWSNGHPYVDERIGIWFKGIGSYHGVLYNNRFGSDGLTPVLEEVRCNGETIFKLPQAGIEDLETTPAEATYYDLQGRPVAHPDHGVYLRIADGKVTKVVL